MTFLYNNKRKCTTCGCSSNAHDWKLVHSVQIGAGIVKKFRVYCKECRNKGCASPLYEFPPSITFEKAVEIINVESE